MSDLTPLGLPAHLRRLVTPGSLPDRQAAADLGTPEAIMLAGYLGAFEEWTPTLRLAVGAWLSARRDEAAQGTWGEFVSAFASECGRSPATVGTWMRAAQKAYAIDAPKGSKTPKEISRASRTLRGGEGDDRGPCSVCGAAYGTASPIPPDDMVALTQMAAAAEQLNPEAVAAGAVAAVRLLLEGWSSRYLVALGMPTPAPAMRSNEKLIGRSAVGLTTARPANRTSTSPPATECIHPPKARYRGTSGVTMCKACGKVAR